MLALGLVLNTVGIGLFCWLILTLAVYALPFFVAVSAGMAALQSGAGILGAPLVGIVAGGMTLAIGQTAFAIARFPILRAAIAAAFAFPAAIAGYQVVFAMSQLGCPRWHGVRSSRASARSFIGGTAWTRLAILAEPRPLGRAGSCQAHLLRVFLPLRTTDSPLHLPPRSDSRRSAR